MNKQVSSIFYLFMVLICITVIFLPYRTIKPILNKVPQEEKRLGHEQIRAIVSPDFILRSER